MNLRERLLAKLEFDEGYAESYSFATGPVGMRAEHTRTKALMLAMVECLVRADDMREELTGQGGSYTETAYLKALAAVEAALEKE